LAEAIAEEWRAQGETVNPETMPMMRLAATAIDRVAPQREAVIDTVAAYGGSDLLCYRAEEPADLVERQKALWQPLLDWAALRFDAPLRVASGIMPVEQPADSCSALRRAVEGQGLLYLTALADLVHVSGSLVVALALIERHITVEAAIQVVFLDELYQAERWGEDDEAAERRAIIVQDLAAIMRFLTLVEAS
jgi:chaperone required for assembly of F1-ATPase